MHWVGRPVESSLCLLMMTTRETVKIKTLEGEHKQAILGNGADAEEYIKHLMSSDHLLEKKGYGADLADADEYVKHLMTFDRLLDKKGCGADLADAAKAVLKAGLTLKKHVKVPKGGNDPAKAIRLTEVKAAEKELTAAKVVESTITCLAYELFAS